jgi:hypothetical protein
MDPSQLSQGANIDRRILLTAISVELAQIVDIAIYEKNPMTYARAIDVNVYIKRDFKPLDDRVHDIVTIEDQTANIMTAATCIATGDQPASVCSSPTIQAIEPTLKNLKPPTA